MIYYLFVALAFSFTTVGTREPIAQRVFRPYGYYSIVGKAPKGFANIDTIQYWQRQQEQTGPDISERLAGVNVVGGGLYRYESISVDRRSFVFTTRRVKGISYSFTGRFLRTDFMNQEFDLDKPVVAGKLIKFRNGVKVAEANIRLSYFAGT